MASFSASDWRYLSCQSKNRSRNSTIFASLNQTTEGNLGKHFNVNVTWSDTSSKTPAGAANPEFRSFGGRLGWSADRSGAGAHGKEFKVQTNLKEKSNSLKNGGIPREFRETAGADSGTDGQSDTQVIGQVLFTQNKVNFQVDQ